METTASANSNFLFQKNNYYFFFDVCVKTSYLKRSLVKRVLRLLGEQGQLGVNGFFQKETPMWKLLEGSGINQVPVGTFLGRTGSVQEARPLVPTAFPCMLLPLLNLSVCHHAQAN